MQLANTALMTRPTTGVELMAETKMNAIVQDEYGSADVLRLEQTDRPVAGDNEVLVRVHAAGVDRGVWHVVTGLPYLIRIAGFGLRAPKTRIPGMDLAGVVEAVGKNVTRFKPGDEVFGTSIGAGAFAEYASIGEDKLALKPSNLSFEQAAALPVSALAALKGVRDVAKVQPGQKVLVIGASGGVGSFAVQIAKSFGAEVTGVASTRNIEGVLAIGADHVIDYTREEITDGGRKYDVILDIAGNRSLSQLRRALTPKGMLVIVGGENGGRWIGGVDRQLRAMMLSPFVSQKLTTFVSMENPEDLQHVKELAEAGTITAVVSKTFPLSQVPDAIRYLEQGHPGGKIVITM